MQFIAATKPSPLTVYGETFSLKPISFPEVDLNQIIVAEDELGKRILGKDDTGTLNRLSFEADRLPGFPKPMPNPENVMPGSRIIILRGGGIGDVLMCMPAIRALRKKLPQEIHITLSTFRSYGELFDNFQDLDMVVGQPMRLSSFMEADYYLEFQDRDNDLSSMHMIDFHLKSIGINPAHVSDKSLNLSLGSLISRDVSETIKKAASGYKAAVYLNGLASDTLRDLPMETLKIFPESFPEHIFIFPKSYSERYRDTETELANYSNMLLLNTVDSLSGYLTALKCCDAVITTDSSSYHIASALNRPCIALFGPISPGLRTTYYNTVYPLAPDYRGTYCSSPCGKSMLSEFHENRGSNKKRCPEAVLCKTNFSPCLASFKRETLIKAFSELHIPL